MDEKEAVALHEAAHAVVAHDGDLSIVRMALDNGPRVDVTPWSLPSPLTASARDQLEAQIRYLLAGPIADNKTGYGNGPHERHDRDEAMRAAIQHSGEGIGAKDLLDRLWSETEERVDRRWQAIEAVAAGVLVKRKLTNEEVREILSEFQ